MQPSSLNSAAPKQSEGGNAETHRLFIALTVPEAVKDEIEKAQAEMRRALPQDHVRWTKREQFHLTLRFLGKVQAQRVGQLTQAVREACHNFSSLQLRAERIGFFPNPRSPRVIWAGIHDVQERLPRLQQAIEASVRDFTSEKAEERFTGHITLGRAKDFRQPQAEILAMLASSMADRFFGEWTADKVEIIRSEVSPHGARHTTLAICPLMAG
jgi:2'-5' RNA ligase